MRIVDRYIAKAVISATALVVLVLIGVESFLTLIQQLRDIGMGSYSLASVFVFVPLQVPAQLYQLFPIAGFLGSLLGLGWLASSGQLVAMRAAGVSIAQIAWAVVKAALLMLIVVTFIGEVIAPSLQQKALNYKVGKLHHRFFTSYRRGLWLRRGNTFIYIKKIKSSHMLTDLTLYQYGRNWRLQKALHAKRAQLIGGRWLLQQVAVTYFTANHIDSQKLRQQPLGFMFNPRFLHSEQMNAAGQIIEQSMWHLIKNIHYRDQLGLVTSRLRLLFWQRVLQPLTTILTILLGVPFIFGSLRSAGTGLRILTGVVVGFVFYMMNQFFGPLTLVYQLPPLLAAATPAVLFFIVYLVMLSRLRARSK